MRLGDEGPVSCTCRSNRTLTSSRWCGGGAPGPAVPMGPNTLIGCAGWAWKSYHPEYNAILPAAFDSKAGTAKLPRGLAGAAAWLGKLLCAAARPEEATSLQPPGYARRSERLLLQKATSPLLHSQQRRVDIPPLPVPSPTRILVPLRVLLLNREYSPDKELRSYSGLLLSQ